MLCSVFMHSTGLYSPHHALPTGCHGNGVWPCGGPLYRDDLFDISPSSCLTGRGMHGGGRIPREHVELHSCCHGSRDGPRLQGRSSVVASFVRPCVPVDSSPQITHHYHTTTTLAVPGIRCQQVAAARNRPAQPQINTSK